MVYALLADGFEESELVVPVDLLMRGGAQVKLVGVNAKTVVGTHGITLTADCLLDDLDLEEMQLLFLPGGQPGVDHLWESAAVRALVAQAAEKGIPIAAICAAPMILGRMGLLDGKKAVCFPGCEGDLQGAKVLDVKAVCDGNFITGKAAGAVFEFAAEMLKKLGLDAERVLKATHYV